MTKVPVFTIKGVRTGDLALPKDFEEEINLPLLAQAVYVYEERNHVGLRKTKTRSEVNRTSKKLYKQKGTGGARHGSRRANLFVGGGVALGPRPVKRVLTLPSSLKIKAKGIAYALKVGEKELAVVSGLSRVDKTKTVGDFLKSLAKSFKAKSFTFILSNDAKETVKFLRNLSSVRTIFFKDANAFDIYTGGLILMDAGIFKVKSEPAQKIVKKSVKKVTK
ncbi:MAG: 50S ribosomal protein L4 [Candidatus Microgenomates bacterium]|jgi:large subunit ribosomal protein L4